jgi:hypothetical protein
MSVLNATASRCSRTYQLGLWGRTLGDVLVDAGGLYDPVFSSEPDALVGEAGRQVGVQLHPPPYESSFVGRNHAPAVATDELLMVSASHSAAAWPLHPRQVVSHSAVVVGGAIGVQLGEGLGHQQFA